MIAIWHKDGMTFKVKVIKKGRNMSLIERASGDREIVMNDRVKLRYTAREAQNPWYREI